MVSVDEADEVLMDRWTILLDAQDISEEGKENGFLEPPKVWSRVMQDSQDRLMYPVMFSESRF